MGHSVNTYPFFLGSLLKCRKALGTRSDELLKNQLLAWAPPVLSATPPASLRIGSPSLEVGGAACGLEAKPLVTN